MAGRPRDLALERDWRRHFERQRSSGLSVRDYCLQRDLTESAFYLWRRTIAERDRAATAMPAFLPVVIERPSGRGDEAPIEIRLANGRRVRVRSGCDRTLLADVLAILEGHSC
jgi:hypothetical protein